MVLKSTRTSINNEIADFAKALHGEKPTLFKAKLSHNFEVSFETIENLLKDQYLVSEISLKHQEDGTLVADKIVKFQGNGTSRRSRPIYKSATEIQNNILLNVNIVSLKQDTNSSSNDDLHLAATEHESDDDESILHDEAICCKAKNVLLSIPALLELAHTSDNGVIPYSLEAALFSSAQIRFHTGEKGYACEYDIFCECRG
jgi:hypothetical protein